MVFKIKAYMKIVQIKSYLQCPFRNDNNCLNKESDTNYCDSTDTLNLDTTHDFPLLCPLPDSELNDDIDTLNDIDFEDN